MSYNHMSTLLNDINELEKRVHIIALSDNEKYEYFSGAILNLKQQLFEIDDENTSKNILDDKIIIDKIEALKYEFDHYLKTGNEDNSKINLIFSSNETEVSGIEKTKRYRINLYRSILNDLKVYSKIDLERLRKLRDKWNEEKRGDIKYSPIEIDTVEEDFAKVFFNYQIKNIKTHNCLLEEHFSDFCEHEKYEKIIKEKLYQIIQTQDNGTDKRLNFEYLFTNGTMEDIIKNNEFWSEFSGGKIVDKIRFELKPLEKEKEQKTMLPTVAKDKFSIMPIKRNIRGKLVCKLRINFFGRKIEYTKKFRYDKEGRRQRINIDDKDRIVAVQFPEGLTEIEENCLFDFKNLEQVYIPQSVEKIGKAAFFNCENLESIEFSENVKYIGDLALTRCKKIKEVVFPQSVEYIGRAALSECENLETVNLEDTKIKRINDATFSFCKSLKSVKLPDLVETIGEEAFKNSRLEKIKFPQGLKSIETKAFNGCNLTTLELPESVKHLGVESFAYCEYLEKAKLSSNIERISGLAFQGCGKLEDVTLPKKLRRIDEQAFFECSSLKRIHLPKGTREIENNAFAECIKLDTIEIEGEKENIKIGEEAIPFGVEFKRVLSQQGDTYDEQKVWDTSILDEDKIKEKNEVKSNEDDDLML